MMYHDHFNARHILTEVLGPRQLARYSLGPKLHRGDAKQLSHEAGSAALVIMISCVISHAFYRPVSSSTCS